jgi:shikimate dehydrogenase
MGSPELFAVAGKPVLHSRSPQMHNAAFATLGMDARYVRLAAESAEEALCAANELGLRGMNVTSPFKEEIARLVHKKSDGASKLGAVNTVVFGDGEPYGCNTDPDGVFGALGASGTEISGKKAVVLGAGGAAKAAVYALLAKNAAVTVANRTAAKAKAVADAFGCDSCPIDAAGEAISRADILVSALSTADFVVEPQWLRKGHLVLDANYASETALVREAKKRGCTVVDGREWLLHQGAKAFSVFTRKEAPLDAMRKAAYAKPEGAGKGNIALIGMMGSGKDSVAKALSAKTGMPVLGTDALVEEKAGRMVREIFAKEGEEAFRKRESAALASLRDAEGSAINCGGGIVIAEKNRKALRRLAMVAWLWADVRTIMARVPRDGTRPLLEGEAPEKRLRALLGERMAAYAESSDMVLVTDRKTPEQVAERILYEIH